MFKRLKDVIRTEKLKHPNRLILLLLIRKSAIKLISIFYSIKMNITKDSTFRTKESLWMCSLFPKKIIDAIIKEVYVKSVLDVGCGTGKSLEYFLQKNIDAVGIENSRIAIKSSPVKDKIVHHNLNRQINLNKRFDLVWCFEVIEHIHPSYEDIFLNTLITHSDTVILSAAFPGQGGHGHFNEKEPDYWIEKFKKRGYELDQSLTKKLRNTNEIHAQNILCFRNY